MIGVIADDFTGATDVAVAFRREGQSVGIIFGEPTSTTTAPATDVMVVALKTRTMPASDAVTTSTRTANWLRAEGCDQLYFKYCSTFDSTDEGNIGPVADALADLVGSSTTVVTPAAPLHGRTVYQGHLFVGDQLLASSPMKDHPLTPMRESNLVALMSRQTRRPVGLISQSVVTAGTAAVAAKLTEMSDSGFAYAVVDAVNDADLRTIGSAVAGLPLATGSAGLASGIAAAATTEDSDEPLPELNASPRSAAIAGSCSAMTRQQVAAFSASNPTFRLDIAVERDPAAIIAAAMAWFDDLPDGTVPLFTSTTDPQTLATIQGTYGTAEVAETVETALSGIARELVGRGVDRIVTAGGETSGAVTSALGVSTGVIGAEAADGVPWIHASRDGHRGGIELLLKSGNFGAPDLLISSAGAKGLA